MKQVLQHAVIGCKLKQNANEGCNSCASPAGLVFMFYCMFYFTCDRSFRRRSCTMTAARTHTRMAGVSITRYLRTVECE